MIDVRAFLLALRDELRADPELARELGLGSGASAELADLIELDDAAAIAGVRSRVVLDAARRGEIELVGRRGRWRVRRGELVRWMTAQRPNAARIANDAVDERAEARASNADAAARYARRSR